MFSYLNLVSILRCSSPPRNPVYASRVDPSALALRVLVFHHTDTHIFKVCILDLEAGTSTISNDKYCSFNVQTVRYVRIRQYMSAYIRTRLSGRSSWKCGSGILNFCSAVTSFYNATCSRACVVVKWWKVERMTLCVWKEHQHESNVTYLTQHRPNVVTSVHRQTMIVGTWAGFPKFFFLSYSRTFLCR